MFCPKNSFRHQREEGNKERRGKGRKNVERLIKYDEIIESESLKTPDVI